MRPQNVSHVHRSALVKQEYKFLEKQLSNEVTGLCSKANPSILRKTGKRDLEKFEIEDVCKEWHERAPVFYSFLFTSVVNKNTKNSTWFGSLAVAGSVSLKQRNCEMSATAAIVGVLLKSKAAEVWLLFIFNEITFNVLLAKRKCYLGR